jgi:hypothetical protein
MAIRAWRATVPLRAIALLVASTSSLGCMSGSSSSDGGKTRAGMTTVVQDAGAADDARDGRAPNALDAEAADAGRTEPDRSDGGVDLVVDASAGADDAADASADAADALDADADAADAVDAAPSACVLGASTLGGCVLP